MKTLAKLHGTISFYLFGTQNLGMSSGFGF